MLIRNSLLAAIFVASASCSAPYQSTVQVDPMTGETTRSVAAVRLDPVQGHTSTGRQMLTGSSEGIAMQDVVVAETWMTFRVAHVSSYSTGLVAGGQASVCLDESLRINIDGTLSELVATGAIRNQGVVTERTWGQSTAGAESTSREFALDGPLVPAFMAANSVLIEYCDIVSAIDPRSLAELQGRTPVEPSSGGGGGRLE